MTVIGTNTSALRAANASASASSMLSTTMERLSTGKRINSAKDDAAGLAIADRMTSAVKSMSVAVRNANDGISMAQTAEGALGEVSNMLQRMKELATQSANGTLGASERSALQAEVTQLTSQIDVIAKTTNFNGINLLDGSAKSLKLQTGVKAGETTGVSIASMASKDLGLSGNGTVGQVTTGRVAANTAPSAVTDLTFNGVQAFKAATLPTAGSGAEGLATAINANTAATGVTAKAYNEVSGGATTGTTWAAGDLKISVGGATAVDVGAATSVEELVANINRDVGGVTAALKDGKIVLTNNTGKSIGITEANGGATKAGFTTGTSQGYVALSTTNGGPLKIGGDATTPTNTTGAELQAMGLNVSTDTGVKGTAVTNAAFAADKKLSINGVSVGASTDASAASKAAAINAISGQTGVIATAKTTVTVDYDPAEVDGSNDITVNGVSIAPTASTLDDVVSAINAKKSETGVVASADDQGRLVLTSNSGANITLDNGTGDILTASSIKDSGGNTVNLGAAAYGSISLASVDGSPMRIEGADANIMGLAQQGGTASAGGTVQNLSIATQEDASAALAKIDAALDKVSSSRGDLGALQNRLEVTVNTLTTTSTNLTDAKSRIEDADFSAESTNLAKAQILSQASTAMLAQANQSQQSVLKLLQ